MSNWSEAVNAMCKHERFEGDVNFNRSPNDPDRLTMRVSVRCAQCKAVFKITAENVPFSPQLFDDRAVANHDRTELRIPIARSTAIIVAH